MRIATSDFITGSCKSTTAKEEPTVLIRQEEKLLKLSSMTLALINITHFNFSDDTLGSITDCHVKPKAKSN